MFSKRSLMGMHRSASATHGGTMFQERSVRSLRRGAVARPSPPHACPDFDWHGLSWLNSWVGPVFALGARCPSWPDLVDAVSIVSGALWTRCPSWPGNVLGGTEAIPSSVVMAAAAGSPGRKPQKSRAHPPTPGRVGCNHPKIIDKGKGKTVFRTCLD